MTPMLGKSPANESHIALAVTRVVTDEPHSVRRFPLLADCVDKLIE
jgi:hypothetical protein